MMPVESVERFDMGRVVSRTFGAIGRNAVTFLVLSVIAVTPQLILSAFLGVGDIARGHVIRPDQLLHTYSMLGIVSIFGFILGAVLQAALVHGTINDLNGKKASFGDCLQTGIRYCLPLIVLTIAMTLAMFAGLILLIVPGVLIFLAWAVAVPVLVVENTGIGGAFGRSAALTKDHRWAILGLAVAVWLIATGLGLLLLPLQGLLILQGAGTIAMAPFLVVSGAVHVVTATIMATGTAAIYYELRQIKEGIGPEQLADVFA
jgi:Uncharacterised protein family (UPF0259).